MTMKDAEGQPRREILAALPDDLAETLLKDWREVRTAAREQGVREGIEMAAQIVEPPRRRTTRVSPNKSEKHSKATAQISSAWITRKQLAGRIRALLPIPTGGNGHG